MDTTKTQEQSSRDPIFIVVHIPYECKRNLSAVLCYTRIINPFLAKRELMEGTYFHNTKFQFDCIYSCNVNVVGRPYNCESVLVVSSITTFECVLDKDVRQLLFGLD